MGAQIATVFALNFVLQPAAGPWTAADKPPPVVGGFSTIPLFVYIDS